MKVVQVVVQFATVVRFFILMALGGTRVGQRLQYL